MNNAGADTTKPHEGGTYAVTGALSGVAAANVLYDIVQRGCAMFRRRANEAGQTVETALTHSVRRRREHRP